MLVAEITQDYVDNGTQVGRPFTDEALAVWWGWAMDTVWDDPEYINTLPRVRFKVYDDDDELCYAGWLLDDDECCVQQFVLSWALRFAGATTMKVLNPKTRKWEQVIG